MGTAKTIDLSSPIKLGGDDLHQVTLRAPKAKDLREMPIKQGLTMGDLFPIAASCADLPVSCIDQLEAADMMKVMEVVSGFLGVGTGVTQ
ncbi:MAG: phage tail assembly protein [Limnobacter sp.]|uniref:phage tail assembly protein n=1 Tax=Limnobacter sp. TaxID=2003368 RepID=UPI00391CA2A1